MLAPFILVYLKESACSNSHFLKLPDSSWTFSTESASLKVGVEIKADLSKIYLK